MEMPKCVRFGKFIRLAFILLLLRCGGNSQRLLKWKEKSKIYKILLLTFDKIWKFCVCVVSEYGLFFFRFFFGWEKRREKYVCLFVGKCCTMKNEGRRGGVRAYVLPSSVNYGASQNKSRKTKHTKEKQ